MSTAKLHVNLPTSQNGVRYLEDLDEGRPVFCLPDAAAARKRRKTDLDTRRKHPKKLTRALDQMTLFHKPTSVSKVPEDLESVFLSPEQKALCELACDGYSVFFTGSAGAVLHIFI